MKTCANDSLDPWVPADAVEAMVLAASRPTHDDGHTDCYYAGLIRAALPHLINAGWRPPEAGERCVRCGATVVNPARHGEGWCIDVR